MKRKTKRKWSLIYIITYTVFRHKTSISYQFALRTQPSFWTNQFINMIMFHPDSIRRKQTVFPVMILVAWPIFQSPFPHFPNLLIVTIKSFILYKYANWLQSAFPIRSWKLSFVFFFYSRSSTFFSVVVVLSPLSNGSKKIIDFNDYSYIVATIWC